LRRNIYPAIFMRVMKEAIIQRQTASIAAIVRGITERARAALRQTLIRLSVREAMVDDG
jgi:hypothetical protein